MRPLELVPVSSPAGTVYRAPVPPPFVVFYTGSDFSGALSGDGAAKVRSTIEAMGGFTAPLSSCHQVHGTSVESFRDSDGWCEEASCDALWSLSRPSALAIKVADCLPVTLLDPQSLTYANIHAGWRGAAADIVTKTVDEVRARSRFSAQNAAALLGPAIRACCFQVGEEVVDAFRTHVEDVERFVDRSRGERPFLDLAALTGDKLGRLGFATDAILDTGICTRCDLRFHSYRREAGRAGRNLAIAAIG